MPPYCPRAGDQYGLSCRTDRREQALSKSETVKTPSTAAAAPAVIGEQCVVKHQPHFTAAKQAHCLSSLSLHRQNRGALITRHRPKPFLSGFKRGTFFLRKESTPFALTAGHEMPATAVRNAVSAKQCRVFRKIPKKGLSFDSPFYSFYCFVRS